ncbi:MAG TPA: hypothetical protein VGD87_06740, partial [Archangium sp.]
RWFARSLPGLKLSSSDPACLRSSFGTLGSLEVSDVLKLDFVLAPSAEAARPLWRPFLSSAIGVLVLEDSEAALKQARFCAFDLRLPVVVAAGSAGGGLNAIELLPSMLRGAPNGAAVVSTDLSGAVRTVLLAALQSPQPELSEPQLTAGEV